MKGHFDKMLRLLLAGIFMLSALLLQAQPHEVKGTVVDTSGAPVIGASVIIQGTTTGVTSGVDGSFSLTVNPSQTIVASYIGYKNATATVGSQTFITLTLTEDQTQLEGVVVVGYGVQKKVNLTGSVASISSKDIADIPVANTMTLLQRRMPGVMLTGSGAQAGNDSPEIRVRGIATFNNNDPMVLIDGVEGSIKQIADIPAGDIESISVLKDAASAAIYGVRAANGVILITTKRGSNSGAHVSYSGRYTIQTPGIVPDYVDSYNWTLMKNEVASDTYSSETLQKLKGHSGPDHYADTDWLDAVLRNVAMHQHHLSVSGGNETTHYMTSIAYSNQESIMRETGVERISFRSNVDSRYKRFTFGLNL